MPLLLVGLMTLNLREHIPVHIRGFTISTMRKEDKSRTRCGEVMVNEDELIAMAQGEEGLLPEFEFEMRAAGQVLDPHQTQKAFAFSNVARSSTRPPRPMAERLQQLGNLKDRLGALIPGH